jgi:hypothetical protein
VVLAAAVQMDHNALMLSRLQSTWDAPAFRPPFSAHCLAPRQPIDEAVLFRNPKNSRGLESTQNLTRACSAFPFPFDQEHQFNRLDYMKARLGLHRPGVMSVPSYCPSRFRDELLPVVNRTSDIITII